MADTPVGIGEIKVSTNPGEVLTAYSLGSCLAVAVYDPVAKAGGMLHAQLPSSALNPKKAEETPGAFVDTGIPLLFEKLYALGAKKERMTVKIAGCSDNSIDGGMFKIGERNYLMARRLFWKNKVFVSGEDVGGSGARTLSLEISNGEATVKSGGTLKSI